MARGKTKKEPADNKSSDTLPKKAEETKKVEETKKPEPKKPEPKKPEPKKPEPKKPEPKKVAVKFNVGDRVKRKGREGKVIEVLQDEKGDALKLTVKWDSGLQYVIPASSAELL